MADIYSVVQFTIELLYPLIKDEVSLLSGVKSEVKTIVKELESIEALLKNAEEQAEENDLKKAWLKQVRNFAYEIEDVVDEYRNFQKANAFGKIIHVKDVHDIATTVKKLQQEAIEIGRRRYSYSYMDQPEQRQGQVQQLYQNPQSPTLSVSVTQESELVGHEVAKQELIDLLGLQDLEDVGGLSPMIAVIGKQHLGKTALVGSVYHDEIVRSYFPIYAWVQVPRQYNIVNVLRAMIEQFYEAANEVVHHRSTQETTLNLICSMDEASLQREIRNFLKEKRYMVVMDDVRDQANDIQLATCIKRVLPSNNSKGSKIIMTTRYDNVARDWLAGANHGLYKLKPLSLTKAWELFCKKAFQAHQGICPPWLHDSAREILNRCNGEPYLISAMGCFLSTKPDDSIEWGKVRDNLEYYLRQDLNGIYNNLIHSSYHILSNELKPCFLYFGLFPKDYEVSRMRLVRVWIAEGFIRGHSNLTLEQVAQEYIDRLVSMNLVEVVCKDDIGQVKTLRAPGFLHDLVFYKANMLGFGQALSENISHVMDGDDVRPRRLSIHGPHGGRSDFSMNVDQMTEKIVTIRSKLRSLVLISDPGASSMSSVLNKAFTTLKTHLLRVLDLCEAPIKDLPNEIKNIHSLRYLSLRNTGVEKLQRFIGHFLELQTLDLKCTPIRELPSELHKLHKLRHLLAYCYIYDSDYSLHASKVIGVKIPKGTLEELVELQKLAFIDVAEDSGLIKELKKLRQLRRLGIMGLKREDAESLCDAVKCMKFLESLSAYSKTKSEVLNLEALESKPPSMLKRLYLNGPLMPFPSWIFNLKYLTKIRLRWSSLKIDPLKILDSLPNLEEVQLLGAYSGKTLKIRNEGFKKLKILNLLCLHALESLSIVKGALPSLQLMSIGECLNLQVPLGIQYIPRMEKLNLFNMPWDFIRSLQPDGQHYSIVKHVRHVLSQKWNAQSATWETYYIK